MAAVTPSGSRPDSRPVNFRLPEWVIEYLAARAAARGTTKTRIVIEAVAALRDREREALMEEGYRDRGDELLEAAEASLPAAAETLPEW
jgi:hypothetical protein